MINCKECIHYEPCKAWASGNILCDITSDEFCDYFKEKTTVGAEPVRHGRWEKYFHSYFGRHQCVCSECKNDDYWKKNFCYGYEKYCPNCGSKMDGKAGEQE